MRILLSIFVLVGTVLFASSGISSHVEPERAVRELSFVHTHTGRELEVTYWRDGEYDAEALYEVSDFLRDFRTKSFKEIDPELFDVLFEIKNTTGSRKPFQVISAYRSPETNEMLRGKSRGVAKNSYHMRGQAIDIRLADVPTNRLRDIALNLGRGGVGYYEGSDFVHVDTGPVRRW
jgi:uncharacterized protein YcbK (DUF882 family)